MLSFNAKEIRQAARSFVGKLCSILKIIEWHLIKDSCTKNDEPFP